MKSSESVRKILIGLVCNAEFVKEYINTFDEPVFKGALGISWIEKWCTGFFRKYGTNVGSNITVAYDKAVRNKTIAPDELQYIETLLTSISIQSDSDDGSTVEYLIDLAQTEANRRRVETLKDTITEALDKEDVASALEAYDRFKRVERGEILPEVDLLNDEDKVAELALSKESKACLSGTNDFEKEVYPLLTPGDLIFYRGRSKGLKSYGAYSIACSYVLNKLNTVIFGLGDLSEADSIKRLICSFAHKPFDDKDEGRAVKKPHLDCWKNVTNECMRIDRVCSCAYKDADGNFNKDYKPCTTCRYNGSIFPATVTHTIENMDKAITGDEVKRYVKGLRKHVGDNGVFKLYTFSAGQKTASDLYDIVRSYYENGKPLKLVVIDHFSQMKPERGTEKMSLSERTEQTCIVLRNMALDFKTTVLVCDQGQIRSEEGSNAMLTDADYTAGASKAQYASAIITTNVQKDDKMNNTVKIATQMARHGSTTFSDGGYVLVCNDIARGFFNQDSFYCSPEHIKAIEDFKMEHGMGEEVGKKKKR